LRVSELSTRRFAPRGLFIDDDVIVFSDQSAPGNQTLRRRRLSTGAEVAFPERYGRRVSVLCRDPRQRFWLSGDAAGRLYWTSMIDPSQRHSFATQFSEITDASIGGDFLAVITTQSIDGQAGESAIEIFDALTRNRLQTIALGRGQPARCVAISSDGRLLATINPNDQSVMVGRLSELLRDGDRSPMTVDRGDGEPILQLAISPDGQQVGFGRELAQIRYVIDRESAMVKPLRQSLVGWSSGDEIIPGWQTQSIIATGRTVAGQSNVGGLEIKSPDGLQWQIELDLQLQGAVKCHTFLTAVEDGRPGQPIAVAIGTDVNHGIYVYSLEQSDNRPFTRLLRWYRDHGDSVADLVVSPDGQTLISGSLDQTVKFWSLRGLFDSNESDDQVVDDDATAFRGSTLWGCDFQIQQDEVVATRVDPDGIAYARSLRNGDRLTLIEGYRSDGSAVRGVDASRVSPQRLIEILNDLSPLRQILIRAIGVDGQPKAFIIRPAWQPTVSCYADRRGEFVLWNRDGYFNASAAEGGRLLRWVFLRGQDQSPRLIDAAFMSNDYERPEVIRRLLSGSDLATAIVGIQTPHQGRLASIADEVPEVIITSPPAGQVIDDAAASLIAEVDFGDSDPGEYRITGSFDATRLTTPPPINLGENRFEYRWPLQVRGRLNQFEVVATQSLGSLNSRFASDVAFRRGMRPNQTPYRMHVLSLASEDYRGSLMGSRGGFGKLEFPIDDVQGILTSLRGKQSDGLGHFQLGDVIELQDDAINQDSVLRSINRLNRRVTQSSDDEQNLLLIYLSGHGKTIDGQYHYVTTAAKAVEPMQLKAACIPWSILSKAGNENCRVVVMIDTCHSGSAVDAKSQIRDPRRDGLLVIAAATGEEEALEFSALQHGCFTSAVLSGLEGEADGSQWIPTDSEIDTGQKEVVFRNEIGRSDGLVELGELFGYVREVVRAVTSKAQTPSATPMRLTRTLRIPLVSVPRVPATQ
ncbi:MAG: caspase family protein, partial [Planctomycetota bacterium]